MNSQGNMPRQVYRVWRDWLYNAFEHAYELDQLTRTWTGHTTDLEAGKAKRNLRQEIILFFMCNEWYAVMSILDHRSAQNQYMRGLRTRDTH